MILPGLVLLLFFGGAAAWAGGSRGPRPARWIALITTVIGLGVTLFIGLAKPNGGVISWSRPWIPGLGAALSFFADGLSVPLVILAFFLGAMAVLASWSKVHDQVGAFHATLLWTLAGVVGVFLAKDLLLFFLFWELMLIPMYFLIVVWGHAGRLAAGLKFFVFTQASGLLLMVGILALYLLHGGATGIYTFDYHLLLGGPAAGPAAMLLMLCFLVAFLVKLPAVPLHIWLPDATTEAPTAGSILLAGLLPKTAAYGLLRLVVPLFPDAVGAAAPWIMSLGAAGIIYGAILAYAQSDLKRMIAFSSVSHLGFILLGAFAMNAAALQGALIQMIAHGLSVGGLLAVAGIIEERLGTRDFAALGGLWSSMPRLGAAGLFFAMAALGLPGLGHFLGEFLTLFGGFRVRPVVTVIATLGVVLSTIYAVRLVQSVFHGAAEGVRAGLDLGAREQLITLALAAPLVWLGLYPAPLLAMARPVLALAIKATGAP